MADKEHKGPSHRRHIKGYRELGAIREKLQSRYGVTSCFLGLKETGKSLTNRLALVCVVPKKISPKKLTRTERIPKRFSFTCGDLDTSITTDVVATPTGVKYQSFLNPGDRVTSVGGSITATIGAYGRHATLGDVFVTAGHFKEQVSGVGNVTMLDSIDGVELAGKFVERHSRAGGGIDYALIKPQRNGRIDLTNAPIYAVYQPVVRTDIGKTLYVLSGKRPTPTRCRGIGLSVPDGDDLLENLIVTDSVTRAGDSGAALVDADYRLWGFLIGVVGNRFSIFMPAMSLLIYENISLGG